MKNFSTESKTGRLLNALQNGDEISKDQIRARYDLKNPSATIGNIRASGYAVYANRHKDANGGVTTKYRLGKPSRAIVAAGYKAMSMGLV